MNLSIDNNEFLTCTVFNLKVIILIIAILVFLSSVMSCTNLILAPFLMPFSQENFSSADSFSYKDTVYPNYSTYQSAQLTPIGVSDSLFFGQANRYITTFAEPLEKTLISTKPHPIEYVLDVFCNIYLLDGNPFGEDTLVVNPKNQKYLVYLRQNDNTDGVNGIRVLIGQMKADSDELYKLKFKSDAPNDYIKYNHVDIVYSDNNKESLILSGRFTVA
jgi:hypothetical protein